MKLLVVLLPLVALCAGGAIPVPQENEQYVEGQTRYMWMPDGEGGLQLQDLEAPLDEETIQQAARAGEDNEYWLFTRRNPHNRQVIVHNNINTVWNSNYVVFNPLMVIVHGYNNKGSTEMNPAITAAYLAAADANVIVVDWSRAAAGIYNAAVLKVPSVGQHLGNFLMWLINTTGGNWNNVHLVGFSLGSHVVGNAGRTTGRRPRRITGLDPAGPQWGGNSLALNANDGGYVECIHTNGGFYGINDLIGRTNFYPNGGRNQPGCWINTCHHGRATELFASSIWHNHFQGRLCASHSDAANNRCTGSVLQMGNSNLSKSGSGIYGLVTGASWPF